MATKSEKMSKAKAAKQSHEKVELMKNGTATRWNAQRLKEIVGYLSPWLGVKKIAERLGITVPHLHNLMAGRRDITEEVVEKLEDVVTSLQNHTHNMKKARPRRARKGDGIDRGKTIGEVISGIRSIDEPEEGLFDELVESELGKTIGDEVVEALQGRPVPTGVEDFGAEADPRPKTGVEMLSDAVRKLNNVANSTSITVRFAHGAVIEGKAAGMVEFITKMRLEKPEPIEKQIRELEEVLGCHDGGVGC